jgi:hypothetical protein
MPQTCRSKDYQVILASMLFEDHSESVNAEQRLVYEKGGLSRKTMQLSQTDVNCGTESAARFIDAAPWQKLNSKLGVL